MGQGLWIFPPFLYQTVASEMEKPKTTLELKCFRFLEWNSKISGRPIFCFWFSKPKSQAPFLFLLSSNKSHNNSFSSLAVYSVVDRGERCFLGSCVGAELLVLHNGCGYTCPHPCSLMASCSCKPRSAKTPLVRRILAVLYNWGVFVLCSYLYIRVCAYVRASTCACVGNSSLVLCECAHVYMRALCTHARVCMGVCGGGMCSVCVVCAGLWLSVCFTRSYVMWLARGTMCVSAHYVVLCLWCVCIYVCLVCVWLHVCVWWAYKHDCV